MEKQKLRSVQDNVKDLKQAAVYSNRKILKPNRHSTCRCKYDEKDCIFKANSSFSSLDRCDTNDEEKSLLFESFDFGKPKDSWTQTSRTIIQLAKIETGDMSPDSLSQSPRSDNNQCDQSLDSISQSNFENFTLDGSQTDCFNLFQGHHNNNVCYSKTDEEISGNQKIVGENVVVKYPKSSLVETFLKKTKKRNVRSPSRLPSVCNCGDRTQFLQQKSPFNKLMTETVKSSPKKVTNFKSRSYVDRMCLLKESDKIQQQHGKFITENENTESLYCKCGIYSSAEVSPKYCPEIFCRNRRRHSFMQPTLASEKKSQLNEIRYIKQLISPIRRGRSFSPDHHQINASNQIEIHQMKADQIPYTDRSISEISFHIPYVDRRRKSLIERQVSPSKLNSIVRHNNFQDDMRRIDQLSLTLPSDEYLNDDRGDLDSASLSSENDINAALLRIQDNDWNISLKGLGEVTEFCRTQDPQIMFPYMIMINQRLIELLKSPRSHVCRTACQAAGHLFESMKDTRGPEFNDIVDILLCKTADANKFIRQDANLALDCMVTHIPTFHAVRAICAKAPVHKNPLVRSAAVRLIICVVVIEGPDVILNPASNEYTRKRILQNMVRFLEDKNLETRRYGERLYKVLSKEPTFDQFLKKYIDKDDLLCMKKTLKIMLRKKF